jgi:hypothetical protein
VSVFFNIIPKCIDAFSHLGISVKILLQQELGSCIHTHSPTAVSSSSLSWNWQCPKCYFRSPTNRVDCPDVPSETPGTALLSSVHCVGLQCCAEGSRLMTGHFFGLLKQLGPRWHSWLRRCATNRQVAGSIPMVSFLGGKRGWCVGLTTLPPSSADCLEIWEPRPPGNLWACPGL